MANPEVDKLITGLSQILERNRQARAQQDAQLAGMRQGLQQSSMMPSGDGNKKMMEGAGKIGAALGKSETKTEATAPELAPQRTAAGGDSASRVALAQKYAQAQQDPDPTGLGKISPNYRAQTQLNEMNDGLGPLSENYRANARAMEMRKQFDEQAQLDHFQKLAAPPPGSMAAQVQQAGNPNLGNFGNMTQQAFQGQPPAGFSADEMAKLNALSQRYPQ